MATPLAPLTALPPGVTGLTGGVTGVAGVTGAGVCRKLGTFVSTGRDIFAILFRWVMLLELFTDSELCADFSW